MKDGHDETRRLTAAVAAGDRAAFGELYELWFDRVFAMAVRVSRRDESFGLDVVHDVMLRVVRSLREIDSEEALGAWLKTAVRSVVIDRLRSESRRLRRELHAWERRERGAGGTGDDGALALDRSERLQWLDERLRELDPEDRRLLADRFARGRSLRESGATLGLSANAASGRIRRAVMRLRDAARRMFGDSVL